MGFPEAEGIACIYMYLRAYIPADEIFGKDEEGLVLEELRYW